MLVLKLSSADFRKPKVEAALPPVKVGGGFGGKIILCVRYTY